MPNRNESLRPRSERRVGLKNRKHPSNRSSNFDPGRRKILKALGWGALGLLAVGAVGTGIKLFLNSNDQGDSVVPKSEFSGEIDETKFYLQKLDSEVQKDPDKLKEHLPQIANLAVSYFSRQMGDMFPERKSDYNKKRFQNKFVFINNKDYQNVDKLNKCDQYIDDRELASADAFNDSAIYVKRNLRFASDSVVRYFQIMIHELHHFSTPRKSYSPPIRFLGIPEPIRYEKGLVAFAIDDSLSTLNNRECIVRYRGQIEETVVEHSALRLLNWLNFSFKGISDYGQFVKDYEKKVIVPLYGGDYRELLDYQQQTKPNEFFRSIGRKVMGGPAEETVEVAKGDDFIRGVLLGSS